MQKVIDFYSRTYSAAFPSAKERRVKEPRILDSLKFGALCAFTLIMSIVLTLGLIVGAAALLGPAAAIIIIIFMVITGVGFICSRASYGY